MNNSAYPRKQLRRQMQAGMVLLFFFFSSFCCYCCLLSGIFVLADAQIHEETPKRLVLDVSKLADYINDFNAKDQELYVNLIPNTQAFSFLADNIPLVDIPDAAIEEAYYFRWWTYRKHISRIHASQPSVADFYVITEFLPVVSWAGLHNTISCAAGHHFREGRWLHDTKYLRAYARFWFRSVDGGNPRQYSFWPATALWEFFRVTGDGDLLQDVYLKLMHHFVTMEKTNFDPYVGLFLNTDNRDGMEASIGGWGGIRGYRPTLNSYMIAEAKSLAKIGSYLNVNKNVTQQMVTKASRMLQLMERYLWDEPAAFYKVRPWKKGVAVDEMGPVDVRELLGYTPWYFKLPQPSMHLEAWQHLVSSQGFSAPFGLTTAEQRHRDFKIEYSRHHECLWNGPSWPYATSITLTALANVLQDPLMNLTDHENYLNSRVYLDQLIIYARAHHRNITVNDTDFLASVNEARIGQVVPWIDENIHPYSGDWISRTLLSTWEQGSWSSKKGGKERGKDYNHSTFVDLVLSGLLGFQPRSRTSFELRPLIPRGTSSSSNSPQPSSPIWRYFCIDQLKYRGRFVTIIWDQDGSRYQRGRGLTVLVDGQVVHSSEKLLERTIVRFD